MGLEKSFPTIYYKPKTDLRIESYGQNTKLGPKWSLDCHVSVQVRRIFVFYVFVRYNTYTHILIIIIRIFICILVIIIILLFSNNIFQDKYTFGLRFFRCTRGKLWLVHGIFIKYFKLFFRKITENTDTYCPRHG